jgi:DHA1 family tetracycline resistance protein-like MFS transporter
LTAPDASAPSPPDNGPDIDFHRLFPILLIIFTNILGAGVILPILPLYAEGQFGGTVFQVTLLATAFFGAQFIAAPVLGRLSDRHGRRPVLILSQIGTVAAFMLFIFAGPIGGWLETLGLPLPVTGGMFMLYVARILDGITGGNITTAQAYVSDITPEQHRAHGLGLLQGAFGAGFVFGPALGGVLGHYGPVLPFIGATIITTGTLLLTTLTLKESLPPEERTAGEARRQGGIPLHMLVDEPTLLNLLGIGFFATLAFSALPATFALYADHVLYADPAHHANVQLYVGLMLAFEGLTMVITQVAVIRPLVERLGEQRLLLVGATALMLGMFGIAPSGSPVLVTLLLAPFAFGQGVIQPSLQSLTTRFGSKQMGGRLLGLYQSARSLALIVGPVWAGYAFEVISPQAVFIVGGGLAFAALLLSGLLTRQEMPSQRGGTEASIPNR